jgi:predicted nuclease of predicted toxin-antitoxin system
MRFIIDAQLPRRLAREIIALGGDAIHTLDLPQANRTADQDIAELASREGRVVITKDSDFVNSHLLTGKPPKLLHITTGNIPNEQLIRLIRLVWPQLQIMLSQGDYVELSRTSVTLHT